VGEIDSPSDIVLEGAVRVLRTGEKSSHRQSTLRNISSSELGELPRSTANETLDLLSHHLAHSADKSLSIGYADNNGLISHRIIDPLKLSAGTLLARDHATGEITTFRIARITGVASL
jgi:predicted DNA-binding transcriptional regulator YafY